MKTNISTTIEGNLKELALAEGINFNTALEFGVKFLLAEKDLSFEYPTSKLQSKLLAINNRLTEQLESTETPEIAKDPEVEADEILDALPKTKQCPDFKPADELEKND